MNQLWVGEYADSAPREGFYVPINDNHEAIGDARYLQEGELLPQTPLGVKWAAANDLALFPSPQN